MTKSANQVAKFTVQFQFLKFGLGDIYVRYTELTKEWYRVHSHALVYISFSPHYF